jgi:Cupredoxin-like domain
MLLAQRLRPPRGRHVRTARVRVKGGYQPSAVHGRVGEPLRIVFSREETASCSEHVVFPAFGKSAMLPPFEDVVLELVPERAGEYEFTCQMGVLRGRLVVTGEGPAMSEPQTPALAKRMRRPWTRSIAGEHGDTTLLAFVAWLCSLPVLLLVAVPLLGWRVGGLLALLWFGVVATACFAVCVRRVGRPGVRERSRADRALRRAL